MDKLDIESEISNCVFRIWNVHYWLSFTCGMFSNIYKSLGQTGFFLMIKNNLSLACMYKFITMIQSSCNYMKIQLVFNNENSFKEKFVAFLGNCVVNDKNQIGYLK